MLKITELLNTLASFADVYFQFVLCSAG